MDATRAAAGPALQAYREAMGRMGADEAAGGGATVAAPGFSSVLKETLEGAVATSRSAETASIQALAGKADLQQVVEAVTAAELSLDAVTAVRDKVVAAYQEILRMPI